jgi:hypothetical protein
MQECFVNHARLQTTPVMHQSCSLLMELMARSVKFALLDIRLDLCISTGRDGGFSRSSMIAGGQNKEAAARRPYLSRARRLANCIRLIHEHPSIRLGNLRDKELPDGVDHYPVNMSPTKVMTLPAALVRVRSQLVVCITSLSQWLEVYSYSWQCRRH